MKQFMKGKNTSDYQSLQVVWKEPLTQAFRATWLLEGGILWQIFFSPSHNHSKTNNLQTSTILVHVQYISCSFH